MRRMACRDLINQLCDRALVEAAATNRPRIDRAVIQHVWADIQQLPAPWDTPAPTTAPAAPLQVVEFGQLDQKVTAPSVATSPYLSTSDDDDDSMLEVDSTELDLADETVVARTTASEPKAVAAEKSATNTADPFAEEFDEEEVVLDSFASWDDMFRRDVPRVQNRRDPEFASLVQSAISTADVGVSASAAKPVANLRMIDEDADDAELELESSSNATASSHNDAPGDWPPLRLAVVSDVPINLPTLDKISGIGRVESTDWNVPRNEYSERDTWSRSDTSHAESASQFAREEEPVLIVEDDNPTPKSPVRREEYRNLFSRLRSG